MMEHKTKKDTVRLFDNISRLLVRIYSLLGPAGQAKQQLLAVLLLQSQLRYVLLNRLW